MNQCNLNYSKDQYEKLQRILKLLNKGFKGSLEEITSKVRKAFNGNGTRINLSEANDESSKYFKEDVRTIISEIVGSHIWPQKYADFYIAVLNAFYEINPGDDLGIEIETSEMKTDEEKEITKISKLEDAIYQVYGPRNKTLQDYLYNYFASTLRRQLIYNEFTSVKYSFTEEQINNQIIEYKEKLFNNLVNFLNIEPISLYDDYGYFNASLYFKTIDQVKQKLNEYIDLNSILNEQVNDLLIGKHRDYQIDQYHKLIEFVKENDNKWLEETFGKNFSQNELPKTLFVGNQFSANYIKLKNRILKLIKDGSDLIKENPELKKEIINIINEIEIPKSSLLSIVNDYFILTNFDSLLNYKLSNFIGINDGFILNDNVGNVKHQKYNLKQDHKHQNAGWETSNKADSEQHISIGTKDILDSIQIFKYNENHSFVPLKMSVPVLIQAFWGISSDIINDKIIITANTEKDPLSYLKSLINNLDQDVLVNTLELFRSLFKQGYIIKGQRLIDYISTSIEFTNQHKHVLYSFYEQVLSLDNENSIINSEIRNFNSKHDDKFLEITSDLIGIIYRNVPNKYIDTDLRSKKIGIQRTFNWDSDTFEQIERINYYRNIKLENLSSSEFNQNYEFSKEYGNTYKSIVKIDDTELGFEYKLGSNNIFGIFASNLQPTLVNSDLLKALQKINILDYKNKLLSNQELDDLENKLKKVLEFIDYYLDLDLNTETGLDTLETFKSLYSNNYLQKLLIKAMQVAESDRLIQNFSKESNSDLKNYLLKSEYAILFGKVTRNPSFIQNIFEIQGSKIYINSLSSQDQTISDFMRCRQITTGKSIKSTTRNKNNDSVANFAISKLASEIQRRIEQIPQSMKDSNIFGKDGSLDKIPVLDSEIRTFTGDVLSVANASTGELFMHSILDKFYGNYIRSGKIMFQPTIYSDKTSFINYLANLDYFRDNDVMDLSKDFRNNFIKSYKDTFLDTHQKILNNVLSKLEKLINFDNKFTSDSTSRIQRVRDFLKSKTQKELNNLVYSYNQNNPENPIELECEKDYRATKNGCDLNELLIYYNSLLEDNSKLFNLFKTQEKIFKNHLKEYNCNFNLFRNKTELNSWIEKDISKEDTNKYSYILSILSNTKLLKTSSDRKNFVKDWINNETGDLIIEKDGRLNPFLEKFFYIEGLYSNNLRLMLSGSETNHPDKSDNLFKLLKSQENVSEYIEENFGIKNFNEEAFNKINFVNDLVGTEFQWIYDTSIIEILNGAQGTQFKRNVIITATLQHLNTGIINGSSQEVNVCVIKDTKAPVNNLRESSGIDANDGSAKMSPIQVILENNSLGEQRVGTNRKPIWDSQTSDMTSFLAKFAAYGITNSTMRLSRGSQAYAEGSFYDSSDYNLFKKMHSIKFDYDLTHNIYTVEGNLQDQFEINQWFRQTILNRKRLFYKNNFDEIIEIVGFGRDENGDYFTEEKTLSGVNKVYHYFDNESNHYNQYREGLHSIQTLFELFESMGGIYCVDQNGENSEFSHQVLANFVINVGHKINPIRNISKASDVYQPLKDKFIAYAFNASAVKNGAKNINESYCWYGNSKLNTFKLNVKGLGIQLNADHDVTDSELTEFSQVIAACAAYGKTFSNAEQLYLGLAKQAVVASSKELQYLNDFLTKYGKNATNAKYNLYLILGKLIAESKSNNDLDLTERIKYEVRNNLQQNNSELKLPFSDPSIYSQFITNITAVINRKSIKRKHPGSGYVMSPSYNTIQTYALFDKKTGKYKKYLFQDVLDKAYSDYRKELISILERNGDNKAKYLNLKNLISRVSEPTSYSDIPFDGNFKINLVNRYLQKLQGLEQFRKKEWFMPTDIVKVILKDGSSYELDLSNMKDYYAFKDRIEEPETTFQLCITKPNNLKPSFIRWQYIGEDNESHFMNIYDHPIIKNSWNKDISLRPTQAEIQQVLDNLNKGYMNETTPIIKGSLENTAAEVVLGNMFKGVFDTKGKSLAYIRDRGSEFFKKDLQQLPKGPYHLAFTKNNGHHTLITFSPIQEHLQIYEDQFKDEFVDSTSFEIYNKKDGFKIGKYVESQYIYDSDTNRVLNEKGEEIKDGYFIVRDSEDNCIKVLKRIDFIKRYKFSKVNVVNGKEQIVSYTLYRVMPVNSIKDALTDAKGYDVFYQISNILKKIYGSDNFINIELNNSENLTETIRKTISSSLVNFGRDTKLVEGNIVRFSEQEIKNLPKFDQYIIKLRNYLYGISDYNYNEIIEERKDSLSKHEQIYVSFLNSLQLISSRIPAQSLQSFMPMECVGWTDDQSNTAYVSYIQTYLQGSDYDIDKAYIMGSSYSDNGTYVGWSNLFDYRTQDKLEASKTLPIPRGFKLTVSANQEYSIDNELNLVLNNNGAERIRYLANLIKKIDRNEGKYNYTLDNIEEKEKIIKLVQKHENYEIPSYLEEKAFKNLSSANIYQIVHDIRNRDQAYSPITMEDLQHEAKKSPKGLKTKQLNMFNPLTKYIMQNQNLVGKGVIGIAANGEKDWFNLTQYYQHMLRNESDLFNLKMNHTYHRIKNRAKGLNNIEKATIKHIPDLWNSDNGNPLLNISIRQKLRNQFYEEGVIVDDNDKYVDQLISQLLSAATDNAKELILAKINAGTNLAKYYLHLIIMGFDLSDIVAFMTSPVVELIDKYSSSNIYLGTRNSINDTISLLRGKLKLSQLIESEDNSNLPLEEQQEILQARMEFEQDLMIEGKKPTKYSDIIKKLGDLYKKSRANSLDDFIQKYIKANIIGSDDSELKGVSLPKTESFNVNKLFNYINQIIEDINSQIIEFNSRTKSEYSLEDFENDLQEFEKLTEEANETSTLASVWLKFNQGIPQTDQEILKRIKLMNDTVKFRENKFGLQNFAKKNKINTIIVQGEEEENEEIKNRNTKELKDIIIEIQENNPDLTQKEILQVLEDASEIIGNFDIYKFLSDVPVEVSKDSIMMYKSRKGDVVGYRELAAKYYNLIKASWNILDIMQKIPHYEKTLDLFNYTLQQRHLFSSKAKVLDELISSYNSSLTDQQYKDAIKYVDKIIMYSYFKQKQEPLKIPFGIVTYDNTYAKKEESFEIDLSTLSGLDSFKHFVENEFYDWLKKRFPDNVLANGQLVRGLNHGQSILYTKLNLFEIDYSVLNKQLFSKYLLAMDELNQENFSSGYTVGDILMMYNLLVNGTRLGGKYLTALFVNSVEGDTELHRYYKFLGDQDFFNKTEYLLPTKKDFLINIAPAVFSEKALVFRKEPYVKVKNPLTGFDVYKRFYSTFYGEWKYKKISLLDIDNLGLSKEEINDRTFNYTQNSLMLFPELNKLIQSKNVFKNKVTNDWVTTLNNYIRQGRLIIYKLC